MAVLSERDWRYPRNGKATDGRFVVGNYPAAHSRESATAKISWPQACQRPRSSYWNPFCAEDRNRLGGFATGIGMGQRHDLLAAAARLAKSWCLAKAPQGATAPVACRRANRLVASRSRFQQRARGFWGLQTGRNPTDRGK